MAANQPLFASEQLSDYLSRRRDSLRAAVDELSREQLLASELPALARQLADSIQVVPITPGEPYIVSESNIITDVSHIPLRRGIGPGPNLQPIWTVTYAIPFTGDAALLRCRPSRFHLTLIRAAIAGTEIRVSLNELIGDVSQMKAAFDTIQKDICQHLTWMEHELASFNSSVERFAATMLQSRLDALLAQAAKLARLGTPVHPSAAPPSTYPVSLPKKTAPPLSSPPAARPAAIPDPTLSMETYEHILRVITDSGIAMERTPASFANQAEPALRNQLLVALNSHYRGEATAETFNNAGHTDILVRRDGQTLFIGECKMWTSAGAVGQAIDQVQKYVTWRDTKTAIIFFCRKGISAVRDRIIKAFQSHGSFARQVDVKEGSLRFVMIHPADSARTFLVTVLLFHLPTERNTPTRPAVDIGPFHD